MALALNNLKRVDMPLNKENKTNKKPNHFSLSLSLYIYIYTHTHTHTHIYIYIYIYIYIKSI